MDFPASHVHSIQNFKFFNLSGFNWMFSASVQAADNNQQIVEGIASLFARQAGVKLENVREAFENFRYPLMENNLLLVYRLNNDSKVYLHSTCKCSDIYQNLSSVNSINFVML